MISLEWPFVIIIYGFRNTNVIVNKAADNLNGLLEIFPSEFSCNNEYNSRGSLLAHVLFPFFNYT